MNQTERLYRIDQLIHQRTVVPFDDLLRELEISRATLKRDVAYMRDRLNAPIVYDRDRGGYCFAPSPLGPQYGLPGLWFNDREVLALLTMHRMLEDLDTGGLLGPHIQPLIARLKALLGTASDSVDEIMKRVRVIAAQNRPVAPNCFEVVGSALVSRRRIEIAYFTRSRNARGLRELSPQRLVHYRNAWYLDAWCHRTDSLRVFALDAIEQARLVDRRARDVSLAEVDRQLGSGYGIYRGRRLAWAILRFSADAARWVRAEIWHPKQQSRDLDDGRFELRVPFGATPELEMDILRHGEQVEVVAPASLRQRIAVRLAQAQAPYR
ncbi:MAG: WYL domain-containing protein [Burkholderiales bacterium]|nr:MAG: WYL domain-containing protein [Burkholderiales bacterium]